MIGFVVRILLALGGSLAALFVARDSPNFGVVQGMLSTVVLVCVVLLVVLWRWKRGDDA
jgi:predicted signal transduction protein with EAL and GGDEF domain